MKQHCVALFDKTVCRSIARNQHVHEHVHAHVVSSNFSSVLKWICINRHFMRHQRVFHLACDQTEKKTSLLDPHHGTSHRVSWSKISGQQQISTAVSTARREDTQAMVSLVGVAAGSAQAMMVAGPAMRHGKQMVIYNHLQSSILFLDGLISEMSLNVVKTIHQVATCESAA